MLKVMKSNTYEDLQEQLKEQQRQRNDLEEKLVATEIDLNESYAINEQLQKEKEELESEVERLNDVKADKNEVKLLIGDDIVTITPYVRYKEDVVEKLIELGYLDDVTAQHTFAPQLALMTVAHESLTQLIDSFE